MTAVLGSLLIVLILVACRGSAERPVMTPDVKELHIYEGDSLEITCTSPRRLKFSYPASNTDWMTTSPVEMQNSQVSGNYQLTLRRQTTIHGDTGYYGCAANDVEVTPDVYDEPDVSWMYVYVRSNISWFVSDDQDEFKRGLVGGQIIFPCRPTSPDYKVVLTDSYGDAIKTGDKLSFDPRIGFKLERLTLMDSGYYKCEIEMENTIQVISYLITVEKAPELYPPRIDEESLRHVAMGDTLAVNCSIDIESEATFSLDWTTPHKSNRISTTSYTNKINNMNIEVIKELQIRNITEDDGGEYICTISTWHGKKMTKKYVEIHDPSNKYLTLTRVHDQTDYRIREHGEVTWVVQVDGYPRPELTWFKNNSMVIRNSSTHEITIKNAQIALKIKDLKVEDMGIYTLHAVNGAPDATLNFSLEVTARPLVEDFMVSPYYLPNIEAAFHCRAVAYPAPQVTWTFSPLNSMTEIHPNSTQVSEMTETFSTATLLTTSSGSLNCSSCNEFGCDSAVAMIFVSDIEDGFGVIAPKHKVTAGDALTLICAASIYNYTDYIKWQNEDDSDVVENTRVKINKTQSRFTYQSILDINPVEKWDEQGFKCRGVMMPDMDVYSYYRLEVYDPVKPHLIDTNLNKSENTYKAGIDNLESIVLKCYVEGMPEPKITWLKDNTELKPGDMTSDAMRDYTFVSNNQELHIEHLLERVSGKYTCRAKNRVGETESYQTITVKTRREVSKGLIISIVILVLVVIILIIYFSIKVHREKVMRKQLMEAGLTHFEEGAIECLNPELTVDDQAELLPYDKKWEFPRERLKFGKQLGCGAFGVVMKAEAQGIVEDEEVTTVAVKMVRRSTESTYIRALASELKIMVHLGKHLNVVNLLGACTKNIAKRELLVIVEYCRYGNLHNYLFRHRSEFINQIDPATGKIDLTIGLELLKRSVSVGSNNSLSIGSGNGQDSAGYSPGPDSQGVSMSPDGMVMSNNSVQPGWRSNYRGDYKDHNLKPICTQDLLSWAFQVARGMDYLSQRKVLHGDLAARNILLSEDNIVKICDFGLAKTMYKDDNYKKKGDAPLPIKWMAIESIRDRVFSTQSDIWSFGIVLWEFFTLAETPYPGMEAEKQYQKLIEGYRMEKPEFATQEIYDIMFRCWKAKPTLRPTFTELVDAIGELLEDNVKMHYVDLNTPYMDMNTMIQNDYLTMMSAPDHDVLSSPTQDYVNSPTLQTPMSDNSYICMSPSSRKDDSVFSPRAGVEKTHFAFPEPPRHTIHSDSDSEPVELSPMLKNTEDDNYLKPINVQERRAEFARQRQAQRNSSKDQAVERDSGYCNTPHNMRLLDFQNTDNKDEPDTGKEEEKLQKNEYNSGIIRTQDNYVNMPRNKNEARKDIPDSFTNPSYVMMNREIGQIEG